MKLWQALPPYDGWAKLSTWIYAITRNASISALRARRPVLSMSEPTVREAVEGLAAPSGTAAGDRALRRSIEALPEKQRQAVTLYYLDERPV